MSIVLLEVTSVDKGMQIAEIRGARKINAPASMIGFWHSCGTLSIYAVQPSTCLVAVGNVTCFLLQAYQASNQQSRGEYCMFAHPLSNQQKKIQFTTHLLLYSGYKIKDRL